MSLTAKTTLNTSNAQFIKSAPSLKDCPEWDYPEMAMVGRSNVGKSSLINALLNRKGLAKTSNTPGKTRLINLYTVNEMWAIADLPGYGYAKVSKTEQQSWQKNMEQYLTRRPNLKLVLLLVDSRIPPQASDTQMAQWLIYHQLPFVVVFTKTDDLKQQALQKRLKTPFLEPLETSLPPIMPVSVKSKQGVSALLPVIGQYLGFTS